MTTIPCLVKEFTDEESEDASLAENIHRRYLSPIEEAMAYERLRNRGLTYDKCSERVGRSVTHIQNLLKMLKLPSDVQARIHHGDLRYTTVLERYSEYMGEQSQHKGGNRKKHRPGGSLSADVTAIVSHWRRRHDRLAAGIHAILNKRDYTAADLREMLDKLLKLDLKPLIEEPSGRQG